jgi:2-polyprenyl-6-methoxyphenol hydroxylase-like FAD-dependent oxidoreductase
VTGEKRDAVIVGARCAGSTLAIALAERGWDVALSEPDAGQDLRDTATRLVEPSELMTQERLERWFAAPEPAGA